MPLRISRRFSFSRRKETSAVYASNRASFGLESFVVVKRQRAKGRVQAGMEHGRRRRARAMSNEQ